MDRMFHGIRWICPEKLYVSQLYVSRAKLQSVQSWLTPATLQSCQPLPVHDFGDGVLTLTDGHTRALALLLLGQPCPICYDTEEAVTGSVGQAAYRMAIDWCRAAGICTVPDLRARVVEEDEYKRLWLDRCKQAFVGLDQEN